MSGQPSREHRIGPFRRLFHRPSRTPSPSGGASVTVATPSQVATQPTSTGISSSHDILNLALARLDLKDQATIREHLPANISDISSSLDEVYKAATDKRQLCEAQRWTWTFRGRPIRLRDCADRVLLWIDRFKNVGDLAVSADPLHAGIPWAGVRLLLEIIVSERQEMAALLAGLDTALYMMNRLRLYIEYHASLPTTTSSTPEFKKALVEFYALILQFLATAIQTLQNGSLRRTFSTNWSESGLKAFEGNCDKIATRTSEQAQICGRELSRRGFDDATRRHDDLLKELKDVKSEYDEIKNLLTVLQDKIDQGRLPVAHGAAFDSYEQQHDSLCLENTRVDLLNQIDKWAADPDAKPIFWLRGMAGTGKSTISRTVAQNFHKRDQLGASFFFKRGAKGGDRASSTKFFTTLAAQLSKSVPSMQQEVSDALDVNPDLPEKDFKQQFERLVLKPLSQSLPTSPQGAVLVVIIDALDECEGENDVEKILRLLEKLKVIVRLRLFVTSRPEFAIVSGFNEMDENTHHDAILHEITENSIEHDIELYLRHEFGRIRQRRSNRLPRHALADDWPGEENIQILTKKAVPLFIFASTISRFIGDLKGDPELRLSAVLKRGLSSSKLDDTYQPILDQILREEDEENREELINDFKGLVGPIVVLFEPLSANDLAKLLDLERRRVDLTLERLQSVLDVPEDPNMPVRLLHLSFRDYLVDPRKRGKHELWIEQETMHTLLANRCLDFLSEPGRLRSDICNIGDAGRLKEEVDPHVIKTCIPSDVSYACLYWIEHLRAVEAPIQILKVCAFFTRHFFHWVEALAWLGDPHHSNFLISFLRNHLAKSHSAQSEKRELQRLLVSASVFLAENKDILDSPLQIYASARYFFPDIVCAFEIDWPECTPSIRLRELSTGHERDVTSLIFLKEGKFLAASINNGTVKLWDSASTAELRTLHVDNYSPGRLTIPHNGRLLASCNEIDRMTIWDAFTGVEIQHLNSPDEPYLGEFAFSKDLRWLVSCHLDGRLKLWDLSTGEHMLSLRCCDNCTPSAVSLTNNGHLLVSGCSNGVIRLWACDVGQTILLRNTGDFIRAVAISPDAQFIVFCGYLNDLHLWNVQNDTIVHSLFSSFDYHLATRSMFFENGNSCLRTNIGDINIDMSEQEGTARFSISTIGAYVKDHWIYYRGNRFLRLPGGSESGYVAVEGKLVALAPKLRYDTGGSNDVMILELDL